MQASIKNNVVFCKMCEAHNYKVIDYKTITKDGKNHTQVIARCNECGTEFYFFTKIGIESEKHYVFDEEAAESEEKLIMKAVLKLEFNNEKGIECSRCMLCGTKGFDLDGETVMACYGLGIRPICPEEGCRKDCPLEIIKKEGNE